MDSAGKNSKKLVSKEIENIVPKWTLVTHVNFKKMCQRFYDFSSQQQYSEYLTVDVLSSSFYSVST